MFSFWKKRRFRTEEGRLFLTIENQKIDLILDIGGNVGQTGKMLRKIGYRGKIISFEPIPSAYEALCREAKKDPLWIVAPRSAVGSQNKEINILETKGSNMSSIFQPLPAILQSTTKSQVIDSHSVPMIKIEDIIEKYANGNENILVKIDTQGYEKDVLEGFGNAWDKVKGIMLEMSLIPLYQGETLFYELCGIIMNKGYEPHLFFNIGLSKEHLRQLQIDGIFYRTN